MNLFQIMDVISVECSGDFLTLISAIKFVFTLLQWIIPLVLIILGTVDMFKAMANGDEKETKKYQQTFVRRLIYALVAFLIPFIISVVFGLVGNMIATQDNNAVEVKDNFFACWREASATVKSGDSSEPYACYAYNTNGSRSKITNFDSKETCEDNGYKWEK